MILDMINITIYIFHSYHIDNWTFLVDHLVHQRRNLILEVMLDFSALVPHYRIYMWNTHYECTCLYIGVYIYTYSYTKYFPQRIEITSSWITMGWSMYIEIDLGFNQETRLEVIKVSKQCWISHPPTTIDR